MRPLGFIFTLTVSLMALLITLMALWIFVNGILPKPIVECLNPTTCATEFGQWLQA